MKNYLFKHADKVRDYECDLQGVVNNANYQHYMEHTRHEFLEALGENFGAMHERGMDAFVSRVEIQFKHPLHSGDRYVSCVRAGYLSRPYLYLVCQRHHRYGLSREREVDAGGLF